MSSFGADQFDEQNAQDKKELASFFNWFYWAINAGALISFTFVAYCCQYGLKGLGGVKWGFFVGFSIPVIMMAAAITIFVSGAKRYKHLPPAGSVLGKSCTIVKDAFVSLICRRSTASSSTAHVNTCTSHWLDRYVS